MAVKLDEPAHFKNIEPFMPYTEFASPIDMQLGVDGTLYILEYGKTFYNNPDGKLVKNEYIKGTNSGSKNIASSTKILSLAKEENEKLVGQKLINENDCNNCHLLNEKSFGPKYLAVANRYKKQSISAIEQLTQKVINGGSGNWGEMSMSPHPYLTEEEEASLMIKYILSVKDVDENLQEK